MAEELEEALGEAEEGTELLIFEFGTTRFAVIAERVQSVTRWRDPTPLPRSHPDVSGVIQEQGRVVAVLGYPEPGAPHSGDLRPSRILICPTSVGHIGLPATSTHRVLRSKIDAHPESRAVFDTIAGAVTFLDPDELARGLVVKR